MFREIKVNDMLRLDSRRGGAGGVAGKKSCLVMNSTFLSIFFQLNIKAERIVH